MEALFEVVVFLAIATFGAALARRLGLLAPILLVVLGLGLSFLPGFPQVRLDPDLVLVGILPPLLYVAALETSVPAFRLNLRPILLLAVGPGDLHRLRGRARCVHLLLPDAAVRDLPGARRGGGAAGRDRRDRGGPPGRVCPGGW